VVTPEGMSAISPAQIAGLPGSGSSVWVKPPWLPRGASIAFATSTLPLTPFAQLPLQSSSEPFVVFPATMLFVIVNVAMFQCRRRSYPESQ
jgi:hypothetical protein